MKEIKVAELFAGVGGFRLGLEGFNDPDQPQFFSPAAGAYKTVWANQWEPPGTSAKQFAARCYKTRFGEDSVVNEDIHEVLNRYEAGLVDIPDVDMVVGGFPCQDYSVARTLSSATGIEGKKGVLWWDIFRFLRLKHPKYVLLENVDRLLKSPATQRGRDFAIMLTCLASLGYSVEWRVINSAEYGFPQRRKRVFIFAEQTDKVWQLEDRIASGVFSQTFPIKEIDQVSKLALSEDVVEVSNDFNRNGKKSPFEEAGCMQNYKVSTAKVQENFTGSKRVLKDVLIPEEEVPEQFYVEDEKLEQWQYLKGSKSLVRVNKKTGISYRYSEGQMAFPDSLDNPARTILTGEGGVSASRFKHIIYRKGKYRRLVPDELDQLQGFPKGWTDTGMTDGQRAFCMGNALVVGIPHLIGQTIAKLEDN